MVTVICVIMLFAFFTYKMLLHLCVMKEGLTADERKEWAKQLYMTEDLSVKDISLKTGVDEADMRLWVKEDSWLGIKKTLLTSREFQLQQLYMLLEKINQKMKDSEDVNPKDVDIAVKYTAAIKNLDTGVDVPQIIEVAKLFTTWLRRKDLEFTKKVVTEFDAFIKHRLKPFL